MGATRDPDVVLVESMLAPPPVEDARSSLEYWQRRGKTLPVYKRAARREAREMATRWEGRVRAAQRARFDSSLVGRGLAALGISSAWIERINVTKRAVVLFAWAFVPVKFKLIAGAVVATWLIMVLAALAVVVAILSQI
jgi:hypothetical protein